MFWSVAAEFCRSVRFHVVCLLQTNAAAAGVASAHHATATAAASNQAAKQLLALQIEAKEKAVKLMKKLAAQADPAKKALLQQKLDRLLSQAAPAAATAAAGGTAASPSGGVSSAAAAGVRKQHRPQPLAGITSVLANTPAEQVRQQKLVLQCVRVCIRCGHVCAPDVQLVKQQLLQFVGGTRRLLEFASAAPVLGLLGMAGHG
jgi:hypothetical protein